MDRALNKAAPFWMGQHQKWVRNPCPFRIIKSNGNASIRTGSANETPSNAACFSK